MALELVRDLLKETVLKRPKYITTNNIIKNFNFYPSYKGKVVNLSDMEDGSRPKKETYGNTIVH